MNDMATDPVRSFVRRIEIPPGAPWDQQKAADLNARDEAPLEGGDLAYALRRLEPWRPGAVGCFVVAYVRRADVSDEGLEAVLDGRTLHFEFGAVERRWTAVRSGALSLIAVAAAIGALGLAGTKALQARSVNEATLARLEANAERWARADRRQRQADAEAELVRKAGGAGRSFADVTEDLFWLGRVKAPSTLIQRVRWTGSSMSVIAEGEGAPVLGAERRIEPVGQVAGAREWRIGSAPAAIVRGGVVRPSVVESRVPDVAPRR